MVDVLGGIYDAGTVSVTAGSDVVTGTGTFWLAVAEQLDEIWIDDRSALVKGVIDDGQLKLALPWTGADQASAAYVLNLRSPLRYDPAITQAKVRDLIAFYTLGGVRGTRTVVNATDAIGVDDRENVIRYNRATAVAATLAAAGANGQFVDGWAVWIKNIGAGTVSITSPSLIDGSADPYEVRSNAAIRLWANDQGSYDVIFYSAVGEKGDPGEDGAGFLSGTGAPAPGLGKDGDQYLENVSGDVYKKAAGVWSVETNLKGPQGDHGEAFAPQEIVANLAGRATFDGAAKGTSVLVESDSSHGNTPTLYFKLSNTSADWSGGFAFVPGGSALQAGNNLSDLANAATARANLGATSIGDALFTAGNEAAARSAMFQGKTPWDSGNVLLSTGILTLPNGLIFQWGTTAGAGAKTFATAFPNNCFNLQLMLSGSDTGVIYSASQSGLSKTGFTLAPRFYTSGGAGNTGETVYFFAIGN